MSITHKEHEHWDLVIQPKNKLFDLHLRDVWEYRDLLLLFVKRDFSAQYKQTVLGPLWHFIQPIFTTLVFLLVFGKIANLPKDGIEPILFYMSGVTIWNYFSTCFTVTSSTFVANAGIFGKVYFPRLVIPLSLVISNIVRFGIQFFLLLVIMAWYVIVKHHPQHFGWSWLWIPVWVLMMAVIGLGLGIIISSITTKYRDFTILVGFGVQLLMYATPVVYPLSYLKGRSYAWIVTLNPLSPIVEAFRHVIFNTSYFDYSSLWYSVFFMLVCLSVGLFMFSKVERTFMDTV